MVRGGTPGAQRDPGGGATAGGGANREGGAWPGGSRQRRRAGPQGGAGPGPPVPPPGPGTRARAAHNQAFQHPGRADLDLGKRGGLGRGFAQGLPGRQWGRRWYLFVSEQRPCAPSPLRSVPHAELTYALSAFVQRKGAWERRGGHRSSRR